MLIVIMLVTYIFAGCTNASVHISSGYDFFVIVTQCAWPTDVGPMPAQRITCMYNNHGQLNIWAYNYEQYHRSFKFNNFVVKTENCH